MQIEVFSDVVCPWCYIGKRRLEEALAGFDHTDQVTVTYRSFQLDPSSPDTSELGLDDVFAHKYGRSIEQARAMNDHVSTIAASVGLDFRLDIARQANTFQVPADGSRGPANRVTLTAKSSTSKPNEAAPAPRTPVRVLTVSSAIC